MPDHSEKPVKPLLDDNEGFDPRASDTLDQIARDAGTESVPPMRPDTAARMRQTWEQAVTQTAMKRAAESLGSTELRQPFILPFYAKVALLVCALGVVAALVLLMSRK